VRLARATPIKELKSTMSTLAAILPAQMGAAPPAWITEKDEISTIARPLLRTKRRAARPGGSRARGTMA
jgi:hypothetical protein